MSCTSHVLPVHFPATSDRLAGSAAGDRIGVSLTATSTIKPPGRSGLLLPYRPLPRSQRLPIYGSAGEGKYLAALKVAWEQIAIFSRLDIVGTGAASDTKATAFSPLVPVGEDLAYH